MDKVLETTFLILLHIIFTKRLTSNDTLQLSMTHENLGLFGLKIWTVLGK